MAIDYTLIRKKEVPITFMQDAWELQVRVITATMQHMNNSQAKIEDALVYAKIHFVAGYKAGLLAKENPDERKMESHSNT